jgi:transcription elongation factor Elf1
METNFQNRKDDIAREIQNKAPNLKCPACGASDFSLTDGYFAHDLQEDLVSRRMGGKNVPVVPIACKNCGLIMEFAAGILGFLPKSGESEK